MGRRYGKRTGGKFWLTVSHNTALGDHRQLQVIKPPDYLNPEDPLPKSLTYRAVSLALAVGLGRRRFLSARASPQDGLSPHAVAVAFLRMYDPRDLDGSSSAFYDLTLEAAHANTPSYRGSVCTVSLTGTGTQ